MSFAEHKDLKDRSKRGFLILPAVWPDLFTILAGSYRNGQSKGQITTGRITCAPL